MSEAFRKRDKQNVADTNEFISPEAEQALRELGFLEAAAFWKILREANEAFDNKGLSDEERMRRQGKLLEVLKETVKKKKTIILTQKT